MTFWRNVKSLELQEFRPGVHSLATIGSNLVMACMEIGPGKEDPGHQHPFDQCGLVIEGSIEMFVGDAPSILGPMDTYFIPSGVVHGWKTLETAVRILDVSAKPS